MCSRMLIKMSSSETTSYVLKLQNQRTYLYNAISFLFPNFESSPPHIMFHLNTLVHVEMCQNNEKGIKYGTITLQLTIFTRINIGTVTSLPLGTKHVRVTLTSECEKITAFIISFPFWVKTSNTRQEVANTRNPKRLDSLRKPLERRDRCVLNKLSALIVSVVGWFLSTATRG